MMQITMKPIGVVQNEIEQTGHPRWENIRSRILLDPAYLPGLKGLGEFSHLNILFYLDRSHFSPELLVIHPRGNPDLPLMGLFATRTPNRPNPIALTTVKLLSVERDGITVSGLDALNETPVLDIKPYVPALDEREEAVLPEWMRQMHRKF